MDVAPEFLTGRTAHVPALPGPIRRRFAPSRPRSSDRRANHPLSAFRPVGSRAVGRVAGYSTRDTKRRHPDFDIVACGLSDKRTPASCSCSRIRPSSEQVGFRERESMRSPLSSRVRAYRTPTETVVYTTVSRGRSGLRAMNRRSRSLSGSEIGLRVGRSRSSTPIAADVDDVVTVRRRFRSVAPSTRAPSPS